MNKICKLFLTALVLIGIAEQAQAVPSFARQTGQDCAACHVGSFGPQLTPYGVKFKLGGYTESDGKSGHIPLSAMLVQSHTHTSKDASADVAPGFDNNNNLSLQEVSMFVAGRFTDNIGSFAQITWGEPDRQWSMDNLDLRFVKPFQYDGKDVLVGVSLNNNPTVQDPFTTGPSWKFPYMGSELAPGTAAPLIAGGLEMQVVGLTAYGFYDNNWYAELGGYQSFSKGMLSDMNVSPDSKIDGTSPYWRLAYFQDMRKQAFSVGLFGMNSHIQPGWLDGRTDKYNDVGIDGSYTFLGTREHVFAVNGSYIHESRNLDASFQAGDASKKNGSLNRFDLSGSYHYDKTYGITLGLFDVRGNKDQSMYNSGDPDEGSIHASPNSRGYTLQADWTPFGKDSSWMAPWANVRLGLQYTGYTKFNGASNNYDGFGRDASDNNTLYSFIWFAI